MARQVVIVGAGHAHLTILKNLQEFIDAGHDVTVVSSSRLLRQFKAGVRQRVMNSLVWGAGSGLR